jgi:hypothetical protein
MFGKFAVHAWSWCGGLNTENILYWFIEGQTHFGILRGAKISLALNEPNKLLFIQI